MNDERIHFSGPLRWTKGRTVTTCHGGSAACGRGSALTKNPERVTCRHCRVRMMWAGMGFPFTANETFKGAT
jgi:hypothetical protein